MKPTKLFLSILSLAFIVSSCSSNEDVLAPEANSSLLKSYTISKTNGKYAVDYTLNNATSQVIKNTKSNVNDIFLYEATLASAKNSYTENLDIQNNQLKLNFVDTKADKSPSITVLDDNIVFAKDSENTAMLSDYSVTSNEDGSVDLDFSVKNKVEVDFVYNEEIDTYEVHLVKGDGTVSDFSRNFSSDTNVLRIDFVNHKNTAAKGYAYRETLEAERKPRIIIQDIVE